MITLFSKEIFEKSVSAHNVHVNILCSIFVLLNLTNNLETHVLVIHMVIWFPPHSGYDKGH